MKVKHALRKDEMILLFVEFHKWFLVFLVNLMKVQCSYYSSTDDREL